MIRLGYQANRVHAQVLITNLVFAQVLHVVMRFEGNSITLNNEPCVCAHATHECSTHMAWLIAHACV